MAKSAQSRNCRVFVCWCVLHPSHASRLVLKPRLLTRWQQYTVTYRQYVKYHDCQIHLNDTHMGI